MKEYRQIKLGGGGVQGQGKGQQLLGIKGVRGWRHMSTISIAPIWWCRYLDIARITFNGPELYLGCNKTWAWQYNKTKYFAVRVLREFWESSERDLREFSGSSERVLRWFHVTRTEILLRCCWETAERLNWVKNYFSKMLFLNKTSVLDWWNVEVLIYKRL